MKHFSLAMCLLLCIVWANVAAAEPTAADAKPHSFTFGGPGNSQFLLDGKPFQMICGEMHPARIPPEYWRHRIRMAKAMGLNTVAIYVFWNDHERQEGKYDFSGSRDIGEFLRIAREEGVWISLRPGPYCCGEWDLGGIPTYLLRYPDVKFRTIKDTRYKKAVENYYHALAQVVRPHLAENGGPILIVQIENEYGSYPRRDHDYMVWLRDLWIKEGVKGPFYTADGAGEHYLRGIVIPGVAVGLNPGTNESHFALARRMNPGVPVMSTEVYPGWLRHWGEGNWKPRGVSGLVKFYMDTKKSFNLYMFHGGTNFGFTAGANSGGKGYEPDVTSYDYASPVALGTVAGGGRCRAARLLRIAGAEPGDYHISHEGSRGRQAESDDGQRTRLCASVSGWGIARHARPSPRPARDRPARMRERGDAGNPCRGHGAYQLHDRHGLGSKRPLRRGKTGCDCLAELGNVPFAVEGRLDRRPGEDQAGGRAAGRHLQGPVSSRHSGRHVSRHVPMEEGRGLGQRAQPGPLLVDRSAAAVILPRALVETWREYGYRVGSGVDRTAIAGWKSGEKLESQSFDRKMRDRKIGEKIGKRKCGKGK